MKLPSDIDYQSAIQNPRQAFSDPELREGVPELIETGALAGLPRPRAGNFATVYKLRCGARSVAVRCFTRPIQSDQEARYQEIIRHLSARRLPYTVDVAWLSQGIQVHGRWFPIIKMEWVQGESLDRYVEKHRASPGVLFELAAAWVELQKDLKGARVAHGDLQHGNVVVTPGGLRLVDYDGMFVPTLAGLRSHERGHANYQHPRRDTRFFDGRLDHFSAWVVWVSLVALAHEPGLWERFQGGDDCLLFRQKDFADWHRSPLLLALVGSRNGRVSAAASFLRTLLSNPAADVPPLDGRALTAIELPGTAPRPSAPDAAGRGAASDGVRVTPALPSPTAASEVVRFFAPTPTPPVVLTSPPAVERMVAHGFAGAAILAFILSAAMSPAWLVGMGLTGGLGWAWARSAFGRYGPLQRWLQGRETLARAQRELQEAEARLQRLLDARDPREREVRRRWEDIAARQKALERRRDEPLQALRAMHRQELSRFTERRLELDRQEHAAYQALGAEQQARMAEFSRELSGLSSPETALEEALRQYQEKHLTEALQRAEVAKANFRGLDTSFKMRNRLSQAGIRTAADVSRDRLNAVRKLEAKQQDLLLQWRGELEKRVRVQLPKALPEKQETSIRQGWATRRAQVEEARDMARKDFEHRASDVGTRFAELRAAMQREEDAAMELLWRQQPALSGGFDQEARRLSEELEAWTRDVAAMNEELAAARSECARLHWNHEKVASELAALHAPRFSRYVVLLFLEVQETPGTGAPRP
jgi:exonuclease VII small subunit